MNHSLKSYLIRYILSLTFVSFLLAMLVTGIKSFHEMEEVFDTEMATQLQTLAHIYQSDGQSRSIDLSQSPIWIPQDLGDDGDEGEEETPAHRLAFLVLDDQGNTLLETNNRPDLDISGLHQGYFTIGEWRVLASHHEDQGVWYVVMQADHHRWEVGVELVAQMVAPLLLSLPVLAFLIYFTIGQLMRSIYSLQRHLAKRDESDLSPLDETRVPIEFRPFVLEINQLMGRIEKLIGKEKQFISDAAHEMKTPLAILKIHANNLSVATTESERQDSMKKLIRGIDRTSHLTRQLLTLAKVEDLQTQASGSCSMTPLCQQLIADLYPMAMKKQQELILNGIDQMEIGADPELMRIMLENLVTNALKYSPENGRVEINLHHQGNQFVIDVLDDGEGIPEEQQLTIFERFNRGKEISSEGTGLGLAIVKRIAELHGFALQLMEKQNSQRACCRLVVTA